MRSFLSTLIVALLAISVCCIGCGKKTVEEKYGERMAPPAGSKSEKGPDKPQPTMPQLPPPPPKK